MNIPTLVAECLQVFRIEIEGYNSEVLDELGRFKVWVGNLAAHRPASSRRSLEYRLRDSSNLRDAVLLLLRDLKDSLRKLGEFDRTSSTLKSERATTSAQDDVSHESDSSHGSNEDCKSYAPDESDDDDGAGGVLLEQEEDDIFELSDEEIPDDFTPVRQALGEVHEIVTCLLRFSMTVRNPSRNDPRRRGPPNDHFLAFDIEHVRNKFPEAPEYLVKRLGQAISAHRQYFRYRKMHHAKLQEGLEEGEGTYTEHPSTVATSLPEVNPGRALKTSAQDSTEVESVYTATSYASTAAGTATLRPPPFPAEAQADAGGPFECPICFGIIEATTEHSWKQHVFEDIPPYFCTQEVCPTAGRPFARRHEWLQHEKRAHYLTWSCPFGCVEQMQDVDALKLHIRSAHDQTVYSDILQQATEPLSSYLEARTPSFCILCRKEFLSSKRSEKHLGHHMEQLALFALPLSEYDDEKIYGDLIDEDDQEFLADGNDPLDAFEGVTEALSSQKAIETSAKQTYRQLNAENEESRTQNLESQMNLLRQNKSVAEDVKAPVKFKDALGRKFNFPWHICKTWKGMENLIKQCFLQINVLNQHVHDGHYDLMNSEGDIILPQVWDSMVQPGWEVSMHMWPIAEPQQQYVLMRPGVTEGNRKSSAKSFDVISLEDVANEGGHRSLKTGQLTEFDAGMAGQSLPIPSERNRSSASRPRNSLLDRYLRRSAPNEP